ncbi:hypothetical protein HYS54_02185 [Candidatus Micrarchaeota archaeon]|nr:hypothetical protein [Candidatus Micrarchaeota archaeon]
MGAPLWMLSEWTLASIIYLIAFLYGLSVSVKVIRTVRGGRYATAVPYLLVGLGVLFVMQLLVLLFTIISPQAVHSDLFQFGSQTLQIVAGVFFIKAFYQVYQMTYATSSFIEE